MTEMTGVADSRVAATGGWRVALHSAAPALMAYAAVRALGITVLATWTSMTGRDARALLVGWDSGWYAGIARDGYGHTRLHEDGRLLSDFAFFPLYPGLERLAAEATGLRLLDSGLLVSWVGSLFAAWGIFAIGDHLYGRRVGLLLVVLWAALPVSIVQSMAYSESLFTALAAWSLYAVLTGRWVWAGTLAALAGLTRPVGVGVAAAVVLSAAATVFRAGGASTIGVEAERRAPQWRAVAGAAIAPLGWLGYVAWVGWRTGSPVGYLEVTARWANTFDAGAAFSHWIWGFLTSSDFALGLLLCAGLAVLGWLCVLCVRQRQPLPLLVFCAVLVFLALTTSGYFGSKPRYLLPAFPLLVPVAVALTRLRPARAATVVVSVTAVSAVYGAFWLLGPGPP